MPTNNDEETFMEHDDNSYTYPNAGLGEEVQWDLMAMHGEISQEEADRHKAHDAQLRQSRAKGVHTQSMSEVRRLQFMRGLSLANWTLFDAPAAPRLNRGFAQRLIDYAGGGVAA
jgi:hypothetical protein